MALPRLTDDADLAAYPGAPFAVGTVVAVEYMIRNSCGWHIAPVIPQTLQVVASGDPFKLMLPSLRVVAVESVTAEDGTVLSDYVVREWGEIERRPQTLSEDGQTFVWSDDPHHRVWHRGRTYTVKLTHGFDEAPDLLPVVAALSRKALSDGTLAQRSETVGQRTSSESYNPARENDQFGSLGSPVKNYRLITFGR